jgi:hypothetical protein
MGLQREPASAVAQEQFLADRLLLPFFSLSFCLFSFASLFNSLSK